MDKAVIRVTDHEPRALQGLLDQRLASVATRNRGAHTPALSYAVATAHGPVCVGAVGVADLKEARAAAPDDQYPWFSMTKIATATATNRLVSGGVLELDAPIGTYLAGYDPGRHGHPTVRHLLTHTAGLSNPVPIRWIRPVGEPPDRNLVPSILRKHGRPRRTPGGRARYSNIGYLLLGKILEAVTDMPVEEVIAELVLDPLAMRHTGFDYDPARSSATGHVRVPRPLQPLLRILLPGDLISGRVGGYATLRPFLVQGAAYGGLIGPAGDAARLAAAHLPSSDHDGLQRIGDLSHMSEIVQPGKPFDHGIGWFRKPADAHRTPVFVEHYGTGGGFWNAMRIYPDLGIAAVGMTNSTTTWPFDRFFTAIVNCVAELNDDSPRH
jgi:CubicO group peptidase (beta-lactamase class C family)